MLDSINVSLSFGISVLSLWNFNPLRFIYTNSKSRGGLLHHLKAVSSKLEVIFRVDHYPVILQPDRFCVSNLSFFIIFPSTRLISLIKNFCRVKCFTSDFWHILLNLEMILVKDLIIHELF